jgi:hypothetical protein
MKVFIPREALENRTVIQLAEKFGGELTDPFSLGGSRDSRPYFTLTDEKASAFMDALDSWGTGVQYTFEVEDAN